MEQQDRSRLHLLVWTVCALGLFIDGYLLYISSIALPFINQVYKPEAFELGLIQAAAPIGAAIGAICIGRISDRIGRKSMLIFNLVFFVAITILSAMAWDVNSLIIFRFLIGFGVGMDYPICAAYMAEMTPASKTGKYMAAAMLINCLASPVGVLAAWLIFTLDPSLDAWRYMFASGAIPAIIALLLRAKLPESFLWQAHRRLIRQKKPGVTKAPFRTIFTTPYLKATIGFAIGWFFMNIAYYGIGLFTPMILQSMHISADASFLSSAADMIKSTLIINLFIVLGAAVSIWAIGKIENVRLQKIGFLFAFIGLFAMAFSFSDSAYINMTLVFSGFILFNFFINLGPGITTYSLPAQYYPTEIRATGHGFAAGMAKFGAFLGTLFLPVLQQNIGIYATVALLSFTLLAGYLLSNLIPARHPKMHYPSTMSNNDEEKYELSAV